MISVALMKGLATFITCYVRAPDVREPGTESHVPCHKSGTAVQSTSLRLPSKLWLHTIRSHCVQPPPPPVTIICFKLWNSIFVVSAMH